MKGLIPWRQKENNSVAPWADDWFDGFPENPFRSLAAPFSKGFTKMPTVDV
jgi:hypothetical protein